MKKPYGDTFNSFERAKSLIRGYKDNIWQQEISPNTIDVYRLKERVNQEFEKLVPALQARLEAKEIYVNESDLSGPISEVQNRILLTLQAMCSNKYKTVNPDLTLHDFNVIEQQRIAQLEESAAKFKELNSARIKKGFIMVNKIFEQLDSLKQNVKHLQDSIINRKSIISEIKITESPKDPIEYASPAVPMKAKAKKIKKSTLKRRETPKRKSENCEFIRDF